MKYDTQSIKVAADLIESQAARITELAAKVASAQQTIATKEQELKVASAKVAADSKPSPEIVKVASEIGEVLFGKRLLSTAAKRDEFVAKVASSPVEALEQLKKLASVYPDATVRKTGSADDTEAQPASTNIADDKWAKAHAAFQARTTH